MIMLGIADALHLPLEDESVDAVVCDPPYGLEFMGKEWDAPWKQSGDVVADPESVGGFQDGNGGNPYSRSRIRYGTSEPRAFQQWCEAWAREVLRVLKPGGHLLAFGGTRTHHRLVSGIEDAGFEIRDELAYMFGSGFPKSLDVSKALDRMAGAEREIIGERHVTRDLARNGRIGDEAISPVDVVGTTIDVTAPATALARQWEGWGTALKPAHEPIVLARKHLRGTVAANVAAYGTGALNIDGTRIAGEPWAPVAPNKGGRSGGIMGAATQHPGGVPHAAGRWPSNVVLGCACDGAHEPDCAVALLDAQSGERPSNARRDKSGGAEFFLGGDKRGVTEWAIEDSGGASRFFKIVRPNGAEETLECTCERTNGHLAGCAVALLDSQSGERPVSGTAALGKETRAGRAFFGSSEPGHASQLPNDSGGASRFFYTAKPSRSEREAGLEAMPVSAGTPGSVTRRDSGAAGANNPRAGSGRGLSRDDSIAAWVNAVLEAMRRADTVLFLRRVTEGFITAEDSVWSTISSGSEPADRSLTDSKSTTETATNSTTDSTISNSWTLPRISAFIRDAFSKMESGISPAVSADAISRLTARIGISVKRDGLFTDDAVNVISERLYALNEKGGMPSRVNRRRNDHPTLPSSRSRSCAGSCGSLRRPAASCSIRSWAQALPDSRRSTSACTSSASISMRTPSRSRATGSLTGTSARSACLPRRQHRKT